MKEKPTGREPESSIDPATEARVVALVLGEASDFEEAELNRLVAKWPEMRLLKSRLEAVNELLEEVAKPRGASWKLSGGLRERLLAAMDFFSVMDDGEGGEEAPVVIPMKREVLALPIARPVAPVEARWGKKQQRRRLVIPWRRLAIACLGVGVIGIVVFSPTIFEDRSFVAAGYEVRAESNGGRLGQRHTAMAERQKQLENLKQGGSVGATIQEEVLAEELQMVDSKIAKLGEVVEERRFDAVDKALQSQDYLEAKQDYESAKAMLQTMKITNSSKRIALEIPKNPITIHQDATEPKKKGGTIFGGGEFESQAVLQVNPAVLELDPLAGMSGAPSMTRSYGMNERAAIESERTLGMVADRLKLADRWGTSRQGAVEELRKSVRAEQVSGTDLLGVKVRVKEKGDAAEIAAEVASVYQERRGAEERSRAERALSALESEVRAQEDLVDEKRRIFHTITKAVGIPYLEGMRGSGQMGRGEEELLRVAQLKRFEMEKEKRQLEIQLKTLQHLDGDELMRYAAGLSLPGSVSVDAGLAEVQETAIEYDSTFSLHVSDVSFKLAQAALQRGEWPKPGTIRVEEFVNAFDYGGIPPSMAEKIGASVEQAAHPFMQQRNLLRISVRTAAQGRATSTPLRLTVLLDNSGSMMRNDRAESVQRAFALLGSQMTEKDRVTLITFARRPSLVADRVPGNEVGALAELIAMRQPEGGTNLEQALLLALSKAQEQWSEEAQNRVVLLTDGAANLGNSEPDELMKLVLAMRGRGIAFDACGVGADGYNDAILESLTRQGNGRYYFLDQPSDADEGFARQLAGALRPAAENVKVQVRFNPDRVGRFELFGFKNHRLASEDFRDDTVDAAELAAEEEGNALYQYEVLPEGHGPVGTVSVRFKDTAGNQMIERRWSIPYRASLPRLEEAGKGIRLAACATFLGEMLSGSVQGELVEGRDLWRLASGVAECYPVNARVLALREMVAMVRKMER